MGCAFEIQPIVYIRQSPLDDKWKARHKPHLLTRLSDGSTSGTVSSSSGLLVTTSSAHNLITGDPINISAVTGTLSTGTYYVIYISQTTFKIATSKANALAGTAVSWTDETALTYGWLYPYTELLQVAVEGSQFVVGDQVSQSLLTGGFAYGNDMISVALPNLEAPFTTFETWKTTYSKCKEFDVVLWDSTQNVGVFLFNVAARIDQQMAFGDLVRVMLSGEVKRNFPNDHDKVVEFTAPLRMPGLMGLWDVELSKVTTDTGIDRIKNQTGLTGTDFVNTTDAQQPSLSSVNGVHAASFDATNDNLVSDISGDALFTIGTQPFFVFGVGVTGADVGNASLFGRGDTSSNDGITISVDTTNEQVDFTIGSSTLTKTVSANATAEDVGFAFIAWFDGTNIKLYAYDQSTWNTATDTIATISAGDTADFDLGYNQADANYYNSYIKMLGFGYATLSTSETYFTELQSHLATLAKSLG